MTATESNFLVYTNCGLYMERLIFHQDIWIDNVKKLYWFWWSYVGPNITKSVFVLTEEEEVGEKTHNVTTDANCFFGSTLNTKPLSIKLKQKRLPKEKNYSYWNQPIDLLCNQLNLVFKCDKHLNRVWAYFSSNKTLFRKLFSLKTQTM